MNDNNDKWVYVVLLFACALIVLWFGVVLENEPAPVDETEVVP